jgi:hypothetical protein
MIRPFSWSVRYAVGGLLATLLLLLGSCVTPFEPDVINAPNAFLVVDGSINLSGVTTIRLSRTQNVATTTTTPVAEGRATVTIRNAEGTVYPLMEQQPGTYTSAALSLNPNLKYQVHLRTATGREYESDLVQGKVTPAIESVTWDLSSKGIQIYVSSRDPSNSTHYYRWRYEETWQIQSAFQSNLQYRNGAIVERTEDVYNCWASASSTPILLSSTTQLSQDVVSNFPLTLLPANAPRFRFKYSILVKQSAQTQDEYSYQDKLKQNTETIGSLSDPLPSQLTGNVHCLNDAAEPVIGYVGAATVAEKRIFIANTDLPNTLRSQTGYEDCTELYPILLANLSQFDGDGYLPIAGIYTPMTYKLIGYQAASAECSDCRRHGTNVRPDFWQ